MSENPYAAPQAELLDTPEFAGDDLTLVRRSHIRHEIQLKSVGSMYYFVGVCFVLACVAMAASLGSGRPGLAILWPLLLLYVGLSAALIVLGYGFRRLRPWVRVPGGLLATLSLVAIPVGTLIGGWVLYLMFSAKGQQVLDPAYQDIIAATPQVKYQRSVGDWIAIGIVAAMLGGLLALALIGAFRN